MYNIVGYTDSNGSAFCTDCEDGTTVDTGNESGFVQPIFEDSEWDSYPSCDVCLCAIEDVTLTTDGIEWLHSQGKKLWYESDSEEIEETEEEEE